MHNLGWKGEKVMAMIMQASAAIQDRKVMHLNKICFLIISIWRAIHQKMTQKLNTKKGKGK
jgi:hypothetical protein